MAFIYGVLLFADAAMLPRTSVVGRSVDNVLNPGTHCYFPRMIDVAKVGGKWVIVQDTLTPVDFCLVFLRFPNPFEQYFWAPTFEVVSTEFRIVPTAGSPVPVGADLNELRNALAAREQQYRPEFAEHLRRGDLEYTILHWGGFVHNAFAAAIGVMFFGSLGGSWTLVRTLRARNRERLGLCKWCAYDRAGIDAGAACPECGRGVAVKDELI